MRGWREQQAGHLAELRAAVRDLVVIAGELRAGCDCPPGPAGCPVCAGRRANAGRLEQIAGLAASLARG
ncbi:MAG: hypothetical protein ACRDPD_00830 [Streptosporangiaceae bacterium]